MKIDKLEMAMELAREDESVTSRTARLKKRISSKISKVVSNRNKQPQQEVENENGSTRTEVEEEEEGTDKKIPSSQEEKKDGGGVVGDQEKGLNSRGDFRKGSFSYLNLLENGDGAFPHRTQPIQQNGRQRRRSSSGDPSSSANNKSGSVEYLNQKSNFMARSNPIGLAEPKVRRDGYAVGFDGSFYRSSEHIFTERRSSVTTMTSSNGTSSYQNSERRASTSSLSTLTSSTGFRNGSGIIATGKPSNPWSFTMPFGNSNNNNNKVRKFSSKKQTSTGSSVKSSMTSVSSTTSTSTTSNNSSSCLNNTAVSSFIKNGIKEMESLTKAASTESSNQELNGHDVDTGSDNKKVETVRVASATLESCFQAVDVAVRSSLLQDQQQQDHHHDRGAETVNFTLSRPASRARSYSVTTNNLPQQEVTISLPASRRVSRQASVDREMGAATNKNRRSRRTRRASVEVFNATYEMKLKKGSVTKISSTHEIYDKKVEVRQDEEVADDDNSLEGKLSKDVGQKGEGQEMSQKEDLGGKQLDTLESKGSDEKNGDDLKLSKDDEDNNNNNKGVGDALRGLSKALESLQEQQMAQKAKLIKGTCVNANKNNSNNKNKTSNRNSRTASATVSLTSSRRGSRSCTPDRSSTGSGFRSRRNSMDLYTADVDIRLKSKKRGGSVESLVETNTCHIRCDDETVGELGLCKRCHAPGHALKDCSEFGELNCPRCLQWEHWEDTCPMSEEGEKPCKICHKKGHSNVIHTTVDYKQRRMIVDTLGWQPFREWFYECEFRTWWQLNGCMGVPLYKIYKRNTKWKKEIAPLTEDELNNNDIYNYKTRAPSVTNDNDTTATAAAATTTTETATTSRPRRITGAGSIVDEALAAANGNKIPTPPPMPPPPKVGPKRNFALEKDDSLDDLVKSITAPRKRVELNDNDSVDSGRSTPEHLKKYSGTADMSDDDDDKNEDADEDKIKTKKTKSRTFSETLKMLDDDILAELDVN